MCVKLYTLLLFISFVESLRIETRESDDTNNGNPIVTLDDGKIRGSRHKTVEVNKTYYAFRGIPFAEPPLGNLRFSPPKKNSKWNGILDATQDRSECVQGVFPITGSEDCLYTNVYTTSLTGKRAVMVWIYGGAFVTGNSSYESQGPDWFLNEDVVFVQFNYRLGSFGFLSTLTEEAPGNIGLKDQCLALKWVRNNIQRFGGDPNNVTIFGESAGSASVSYQLQSTCAKGTFHRAIMQSGTSLCLWALHRRAVDAAFNIGGLFGVTSRNTTQLLETLRKIPYKKLQLISMGVGSQLALENPLAGIQFGPVIEPNHKGAFFSNYSDELLLQGHYNRVPTIIGVNSNEAAYAGDVSGLIRLYLVKYDLNYKLLAPADLTNNDLESASAAFAIKLHYFSILPMSFQTDSVIQFISDDQFNRPVRRTVLDMANHSTVYYYVFSYSGALGGPEDRTLKGVGHTEDLGYMFRRNISGISSADKLTRTRIIKLWTNFAKNGTPTPAKDPVLQNVIWNEVSADPSNLSYLNIGKRLKMEKNPFKTNMKFYEKVYKNHGSPPYNTY
ncbi:hypothetical protein JTB14_029587 [Gonioctena quinquepunctata]|nr:hypothetical protein JTB14_029587 [Gonioctena quinquepunctata]